MKLPTRTFRQQQQEEARTLHERLWTVYQQAQEAERAGLTDEERTHLRVTVPSLPGQAGRDVQRLSSNLHRFWLVRAYRFHCRQVPDKTGVEAWIVPMESAR